MSIKIMSKVWEFYPNGGSELLSLLALADWSDDQGLSFPSIASLAKKTRLSMSQARRVVHELIDAEFVQVVGNKNGGAKGSSRRYKINLSLLTASTDATPNVDARGSIGARDDWHECADTASAHASLTAIEPSLPVKAFKLPEWVPFDEWNAFIDHRKKLKKPLTQYSMKLAINQLKKIVDAGHQADEVINETILKGWQSFYLPNGVASFSENIMEGVI